MERKAGKHFFNNYAVLSVVASLGFAGLVFQVYGLQCLVFFVLQAFGAVFYL
jgi:hypothetical protein